MCGGGGKKAITSKIFKEETIKKENTKKYIKRMKMLCLVDMKDVKRKRKIRRMSQEAFAL